MTYNEFVKKVTRNLHYYLPKELSGAKIFAHQVDKLQGSYYGITIQPENSSIGISVNLKEDYQEMLQGQRFEKIINQIARDVAENINLPQIDTKNIVNYEKMKDSLMIQLVSIAGNEEMLSNIPHITKEDMAIVYRMVIESNAQETASAIINNQMLAIYGIMSEQLHKDAMLNSSIKFPAKFYPMREMIAEMTNTNPEEIQEGNQNLFVLTNDRRMYGASTIFYPDMMEMIAEKMKGDYYIIPSSVHEVLILKDDGTISAQALDAMIQQVNDSQVSPEDRLSYFSYHYDAKKHLFEKAVAFENR